MLKRSEMQVSSEVADPAARIFGEVYRKLRPHAPLEAVRLRFRPYANGNCKVELQESLLDVRLSDVYQGAPEEVLESLAWLVLAKLCRKPAPAQHSQRFRAWMQRKEMRRTMHLVRQIRGRKSISGPAGEHFHLDEVFEELNQRFFHGLMARPNLGWSRNRSRTLLGHWDPSHNAIVLSRFLDQPGIPRQVVDYIMYHEMLHLRYPAQHEGSRRRVHTREFREAEKQFPDFDAVKTALRQLLAEQ